MVQTVKNLLKEADDPYMALMSYRATPLPWCDLSPTELLMGRRIRMLIPQVSKQFGPGWTYIPDFKKKDAEFKQKQNENYVERHRVRELPEIPEETSVWIRSNLGAAPGTIASPAETLRSYIVDTPSGHIRRNRNHLTVVPAQEGTSLATNQQQSSTDIYRSRTNKENRYTFTDWNCYTPARATGLRGRCGVWNVDIK